eukprot:TRINITY_DN13353_c0_g1_i3.p1 TRINITY_DN13353_c0_g1~~TRINITY_DN13353_c0_g1_i3.p1  ORF type:complete len:639 (+),score=226.04 TRINITY_DN13353_c0_g1_i3:66-1919(+)
MAAAGRAMLTRALRAAACAGLLRGGALATAGAAAGVAYAAARGSSAAHAASIPVTTGGGSGGGAGADSGGPPQRRVTVAELCDMCATGNAAAVRSALDSGQTDAGARHVAGHTPLMVAALAGHLEVVQILLNAGAPAEAEDQFNPAAGGLFGLPPQIQRARQRHLGRIDINSDVRGFTALHYAVVGGHDAVARVLIRHGAKPQHRSARGVTPEDVVQYAPVESRERLTRAIKEAVAERQEEERLERQRFPLEERLKQHIVGQLGPIHAVASAIRRKENGWHDSSKPLVFLFLGSSGIGKTELAKQVAAYLFPDKENGFIRIDMSEYQHAHEVAKFIGSPPGYVGHEDGGQLTKRLEEVPNAVVLLDEVEKAHPDVLTIMLQVFDEGRITDGKGHTIDCKDAIFVMTSNLAQREIADEAIRLRLEAAQKEAHKGDLSRSFTTIKRRFREDVVTPILRVAFRRDEFLGRINETLFFLPFTDTELDSLVERELKAWADRAKERHDVTMHWTPELVRFLKGGYNMRYGARSIKHEVERSCVGKLAQAHEMGKLQRGHTVTLDFQPAQEGGGKQPADDDDIEEEKGIVYTRPAGEVVLHFEDAPQRTEPQSYLGKLWKSSGE